MRPEVAQQNPEQPLGTVQPWPLGSALQYNHLMSQSNDFKAQIVARSNEALQPGEYCNNQPMHELAVISKMSARTAEIFAPNGILATYNCPTLTGAARAMEGGIPIQDGVDNGGPH